MDGNSAYLVPIATPSSYSTMGCQSCLFTAINDSVMYSIGGSSPDQGAKVWNMSGTQESYSPVTTAISGGAAYLTPTVTSPVCPNGTKETGEACDGTQFGTDTCQTFGFDGGTLSCTGTCTIETTNCYYDCGNGAIDSGEDCDGTNLNNQGCTDLGFDSGTLDCNGSCEFVTTSCVTATCNNGSIDTGEDCDGTNLNGASCTSLGYDSGNLSCSPTSCTFDTTQCVTDLCENGSLDMGEQCDGTIFGGETCQTQGFDGGDLSCSGSCELITTACTNDVPLCGNGVIDNGEQCDDNGTAAGDGCSDTCQIEEGFECTGTPSTCSLIEETCNPNGLVADSTSGLELSKLSSHNLDLYNSHLNTETGLTKGHSLTCGTVEVFGNPLEAITVNLASGTYADLAIKIGNKVAQCHFFAEEGAAKIHINANDTKKFFVDGESGSGAICTEDNANVEIQFQGLILAALGTGLSGRKLAIHPLSNLSGNWLEVYVSDATVRLIEMAVSTNNIVIAVSDMVEGRPIYLNLDAIGDLSEIFTPPTTTPPKGCGCSTGSNNGTSTLPIAFLSIFILLIIRRRKVFGSR
jgi:cysteine-rich repeat protein